MPVIDSIVGQLRSLSKHPQFQVQLKQAAVIDDDLVVLNNSFIRRETKIFLANKSDKHIVLPFEHGGINGNEPRITSTDDDQNNDLRRIANQEAERYEFVPLEDALIEQLHNFGSLAFILIGHKTSVTQSVDIKTANIKRITFNANFDKDFGVSNGEATFKDIANTEDILTQIKKYWEQERVSVSEDVINQLSQGIAKLKAEVYSIVKIPTKNIAGQPNILDEFIIALDSQIQLYATNLELAKKNDESGRAAYNDLLRLAYLFCADALALYYLILNMCDLKPIIHWGTISHHYRVKVVLANLLKVGAKKPNVHSDYVRKIGDARNKIAHRLAPFDHTLQVELPENSIRFAKLKIFVPFSGNEKSNNQFSFQDKEIVDLLMKFRRTNEEKVTIEFLRENIEFMKEMRELFVATNNFLKLLFAESAEMEK